MSSKSSVLADVQSAAAAKSLISPAPISRGTPKLGILRAELKYTPAIRPAADCRRSMRQRQPLDRAERPQHLESPVWSNHSNLPKQGPPLLRQREPCYLPPCVGRWSTMPLKRSLIAVASGPSEETSAPITIATPAARMPYSMAVTPRRLRMKRRNAFNECHDASFGRKIRSGKRRWSKACRLDDPVSRRHRCHTSCSRSCRL